MALETTKSNKALKLFALQTLVEMEVLDTVWEMGATGVVVVFVCG